MKNWKKLFTILSVITCACAFATACKEEQTTEKPEPAPAPEIPSDYIFPEDDDPIQMLSYKGGNGTRFNAYQCEEGYYNIRLPQNRETFFSFSVKQSGVYALYSVDPVTDITVMQYDYVGAEEDNSNSLYTQADILSEEYGEYAGVVYSTAECGDKYYNDAWRATFSIRSTVETTVGFRFVRIGDPKADPESIVTDITAKEIVGKASAPENKTAIVVPYSSSFFYDEDYEIEMTPLNGGEKVTAKGFYRMGTESEPGSVIYAAITKNAERYLGDASFSTIQYKGNNLSVYTGKDEKGNYLINNYVDFIMNDGGVENATPDTTMACYQNAVNAEGLYPVNQELYEFLRAYTNNNNPSGTTDESKYWLAPCYYYTEVKLGSRQYPNTIKTLGTHTATIEEEYSAVYYNVKWTAKVNPDTGVTISQGYYTLTCNTPNAIVFFDEHNYSVNELGEVSITFETDSVDGRTFGVKYYDGTNTTGSVTFSLAASADGYADAPLTITGTSATLTTQKWFTIDNGVEYTATYQYTATANGKLTVATTNGDETVVITVNDETITATASTTIDVATGDTVEIVIEATQEGKTADITLSLA